MWVAPAWVTSPAQWAGWWLTAKLRGPILGPWDLGLVDADRPSHPEDPAWSLLEFGAVTAEQVDQLAELIEQAVAAGTLVDGQVELTVQPGRSRLLADLAVQAEIDAALLPRLTGPWTITVTATHATMRAYLSLSPGETYTGDPAQGLPVDGRPILMWPRPDRPTADAGRP